MILDPPIPVPPVPGSRPWLAHYDADVPPSINYPSHPLHVFLSDSAARHPDDVCIIVEDEVWTYREVETGATAVAGALRALGVRKGDRIGILMPNIPHFVLAFYGILKAGAVVVALNPLGTPTEHAHQLRDSGIRHLMAAEDLHAILTSHPGVLTNVRSILVARTDRPRRMNQIRSVSGKGQSSPAPLPAGHIRFQELLDWSGPSASSLPNVEADDTALFQYSGGTTGPSKAAVATHRGVVANTIQFRRWLASLEEGTETVLLAIPLYHAYGMIAGMSLGIALGARLALVTNPRDMKALLSTIRDHRPTVFPGVPGLYNALANHPEVAEGRVDLSSMRVCISGSTALMRDTKDRFERLSGGQICEGYGLSEAPVVTHCNPLLGPNKIGSIGMPMPDVDCRIVDPDEGNRDVAPGVPGELILRGPQLMSRYHGNPEESAIALRRLEDGRDWLFTGDIARMDEDGYFYIVDRKKDVIKAGGFQVWPRDVEEVLAAHPAVLEVGVAGVQDSTRGEIVKAWVVLKSGHATSAAELRSWCQERLPSYKLPARIEFRTELPKSNVGKVLRRELAREVRSTQDDAAAPDA